MTGNIGADRSGIGTRGRRKGMLIRATLAQNIGTGCAFGGLGLSVLALQQRYDASLGSAALGLSITVLSLMGLGPLIAKLIARFGIRSVMSAGVLISSAGYVALAYAPSLPLALMACALLVGPGGALFAVLPPAILASGWYPEARGKAMGIVYLPILATILPLLGVTIIQRYGLPSFYLTLAAAHLLLFPLMLGVVEASAEPAHAQNSTEEATGATQEIFKNRIFWLIALGNGILNGAAIVGSAHMLPIVTGYGASMQTGAALLTVSNGMSILGSLIAGYACDRIGAAKTLGLVGLGFALAWSLIAITSWLPVLAVSAILIGTCGAAVFPPVSALTVQVFGMEALPKVLGLLSMFALPFTFAMAPAAGQLHDIFGGYRPVFVGMILVCLTAAAAYIWIHWQLARRIRTAPAMPCATSVSSGSV